METPPLSISRQRRKSEPRYTEYAYDMTSDENCNRWSKVGLSSSSHFQEVVANLQNKKDLKKLVTEFSTAIKFSEETQDDLYDNIHMEFRIMV